MITDFIFGSNTIVDTFVGDQPVIAIYLGETLVWSLPTGNTDYLLNENNKAFITENDLNYLNIDKA